MKTGFGAFRLALLVLFSFLLAMPAYALSPNQAKVTKITGEALCQKAGLPDWLKLETGMTLSQGDKVKTRADSEVVMELVGGAKTAEITLRRDSEFVFKTFQHDRESKTDTTLLDMSMGAVLVKAEKLAGSSKFEVKTPTSLVGIRGTTFEVQVEK